MARFNFQLEVGITVRSMVRKQLFNSKYKLETNFPPGKVEITEDKGFLESTFYIVGSDFPDTQYFLSTMRNWERKLKDFEG